ncbi:TetR/AcrR family transcriptional regulator [Parabacteroides sp. OttesenSCG-928-N08]|nr:TetR/AcrR family transcriptional regulator [Parabacteroides sp. OttesenSCG-928-N08]
MVLEKQEIIRQSFDLFSQYGIKGVSMDDIARNMKISKRTLYSYFSDKESLLLEGMVFISKEQIDYLLMLEKESHNVLDIILLMYERIMLKPRWYNPRFYEDLKRFPKAMEHKEKEKTFYTQKCTELFQRGVEEGVFQKEVNVEIVALLTKEQLKMLHPSKTFSRHSNAEVYNTVLITFLRGICSDKGRQILDRWIQVKHIQRIQ